MSGIEFACHGACIFYSFLATLAHDNISRDGQREAIALAECMQKCKQHFGAAGASAAETKRSKK